MNIPFLLVILFGQILGLKKDLEWCRRDMECISGYCANLPGHSYDGKNVFNAEFNNGRLCHCRDDSYCEKKAGTGPGTQFCSNWPNHLKNHWCIQKVGLGYPCEVDEECVNTCKCALHENICVKKCSSSSDCENGGLCVGGGCSYKCRGGKYLSRDKETGKLICLTCPRDHWCNTDIKTPCPSSLVAQSGQSSKDRCVKNECQQHETVEYISWDKMRCVITKAWYRIKRSYTTNFVNLVMDGSADYLYLNNPIFHDWEELQSFRFIRNDNSYMIENRGTSKFITAITPNYGHAIIYLGNLPKKQDALGQLWDIKRWGSGSLYKFTILNGPHRGYVMDETDRYFDVGRQFIAFPQMSSRFQKYMLEKVEEF